MQQQKNYIEPVEESYTTWRNPMPHDQYVDLHMNGGHRPTRVRFKPGEEKDLPSTFDRAIHTVHNGVIIGGLAPLLEKVGSGEKLDTALDPRAQSRKNARMSLDQALAYKEQAEALLREANDAVAALKESEEAAPAPKKKREPIEG